MCIRERIFSKNTFQNQKGRKQIPKVSLPLHLLLLEMVIQMSLMFLQVLQAEALTAFEPSHLFKNACIVNS